MNTRHPTDVQLIGWVDASQPGGPTAEHVRGCLRCAALINAADPASGGRAASYEGSTVTTVPQPLGASVDPLRGQVWRLRWDSITLLGLIWNVFDDHLDVMPITTDVTMAEDATVLLESSETNGLGPVAIWVGLEAPIEWCVLDVCWGEVPVDSVDSIRHRVRIGKPIDSLDVTIGGRIVDVFDERFEYRAMLGDTMNCLVSAVWKPQPALISLPELAAVAGVDLGDALSAIGAPATERLRVKRGLRPFNMAEAQQLAPLLHVDPETILATNPDIPDSLVLAMNRPRWRPALTDAAREAHLDDTETRQRIAYAVLGLAARERTDGDTEEQWHERLKHHFAT